jgi:hypothetical protein
MFLLRRTLRANPQVAAIVHILKVPSPPQGTQIDEYLNMVATLVMACPNLERLLGVSAAYNHSFTKLFQSLSTRQRLKQMNWVIEPSPFQRQRRIQPASGKNPDAMFLSPHNGMLAPGDLQPQHSAAFLDHHLNWTFLQTLSIHCMPGATLTPIALLADVISRLPSLQNLHLSYLPFTAFNDETLLSLPALKTLSLSNLPGVSSHGLSALATRSTSNAVRSLTLRHVNLDSLPALARIFSNLTRLESFSFVQAFPPLLPEDTFIWLMPYLASTSLRKLHWDITSHPTCANAADSILARSIAANGFPALRSLRAPNDPDGIFQSLCSPQERADTPSDRFRGMGHGSFGGSSTRPMTPSSPTKLVTKSPVSANFPMEPVGRRDCTDLHLARLAAQTRLETARRFPRYFVNVVDEDGQVIDKFGMAGFIGTVESRIKYHLIPDHGASDESGGLVDLLALRGDGGEDFKGKEGCSGRWNMQTSGPVDKKDKERWWHTERGRWKAVQLS